jgi:hypothetical protein
MRDFRKTKYRFRAFVAAQRHDFVLDGADIAAQIDLTIAQIGNARLNFFQGFQNQMLSGSTARLTNPPSPISCVERSK